MIALPAPAEHGNETRTLLSTNTEPVDESAIVLEAEDVGRVRLPSSTSASRSILNLAATVSDIPIIVGCSSLATTDIDDSAGLGGSSVVESGQRGDAERLPGGCSGGEVPQMREPHISTLYEKQDVMAKHFGVTPEQALRTQALLRLGVTDEDVRIAERLMATRSTADNVSCGIADRQISSRQTGLKFVSRSCRLVHGGVCFQVTMMTGQSDTLHYAKV